MAKEVLSHDVIDLIEKSKNDGFSDKEKAAISNMMKGLSESDLGKVKNHIQEKVTEWSKTALLNLTEKVESFNNLPYGFEWIIEWSESEFFTEMFESEPRKIAISEGIKNLLTTNLPEDVLSKLWSNQKETIQLLIWNKVVSKIGFMSGGSYMMQKWLEKMTWLVDSTMSIAKKWSEVTKEDDFDITKLWETFDKIQAIFESDNKDKEKKWEKLLWEVTKYFTHLTKDYFSNLNQVFIIAKENNIDQNPDFLQLLDNPMIMNEILEKWEYKNNGIEINLDKKIITGLEKNTSLEADKKAFMKEIVENTNDTWNKIDWLKDKVDKVASLFVKFGFDSTELKEFQKDLKEIPLVWNLLSFILWFFIWDKVFNAIDKIHDSQKYKVTIEKAQVYFNNDKLELPFEKTEKLEKKDGTNIEKFLKSIESFEHEQSWDKKIEKSVIFADNFWETVFSKNESTNPVYKEIQNKIKEINPNNNTISQEDYFVALSKLNFVIPIVVWMNENVTDIQTIDISVNKQDWMTDTSITGWTPNNLSTEIQTDVTIPLQVVNKTEIWSLDGNILDDHFAISNSDTVNQTDLNKQKIEVESEIINNKPLAEQLVNIRSLPMDIYIDWEKTSINIWTDKKSIKLWSESYNISVNYEVLWRTKDIFESIELSKWKIILSASIWDPSTLESHELAPVLEEIFKNKSYQKKLDKGAELMIS